MIEPWPASLPRSARASWAVQEKPARQPGSAVLYRELEAKYQLTGEGYHTWPFQPSALGGVSITAGLTLLGNVAAILYRMYWAP